MELARPRAARAFFGARSRPPKLHASRALFITNILLGALIPHAFALVCSAIPVRTQPLWRIAMNANCFASDSNKSRPSRTALCLRVTSAGPLGRLLLVMKQCIRPGCVGPASRLRIRVGGEISRAICSPALRRAARVSGVCRRKES